MQTAGSLTSVGCTLICQFWVELRGLMKGSEAMDVDMLRLGW